jgi:hypothetical protein
MSCGSKILKSESERCDCDFSSLSDPEIEVFGIDPDLRDKLNAAYFRYENLIGCIDDERYGNRAEDRARFPQYLKSRPGEPFVINHDDAAQFMARAAGLPMEQCCRWVLKVRALEHRRGLYCYPDP